MLREMRGFLAAGPAPQQVSWSMADTAMWEVAKRRADTLARDDTTGSPLAPERVLDEIRLLGPDAYEAACCRSLLRVFAADFAQREGMAIDGDRLHDAVAEFRTSRNLEQDGELARFLADNDLSEEDFERLVVTDEMVRWACGQAERAAFGAPPRRSAPEAGNTRSWRPGPGPSWTTTGGRGSRGRPPSSGISLNGAARRSRMTWQATRGPAASGRAGLPDGRPARV